MSELMEKVAVKPVGCQAAHLAMYMYGPCYPTEKGVDRIEALLWTIVAVKVDEANQVLVIPVDDQVGSEPRESVRANNGIVGVTYAPEPPGVDQVPWTPAMDHLAPVRSLTHFTLAALSLSFL